MYFGHCHSVMSMFSEAQNDPNDAVHQIML